MVWWGSCSEIGNIYCIPYSASSILKINPSNDTASTFGSLGAGGNKWHGGVLAPNGKIYCIFLFLWSNFGY